VPPSGFPAAVASTGLPTAQTATAPGVQVEKRAPAVVNLSQPLGYEIIVRNPSSAPVCNVRVEDELPAGARYLGGDPPPEVGPDRLAWTLNTLEPGAERRLRVELQPGAEGELRSTATVHYTAMASM